jgi:hypothetical protein
MNISVSGAFGYVVNDKLEAYIRFDQGLTKVYPNYDVMRTWNRLLELASVIILIKKISLKTQYCFAVFLL